VVGGTLLDTSSSDLLLLREKNVYVRVPHGMRVAPTRKEADDWLSKRIHGATEGSTRRDLLRRYLPVGDRHAEECLLKVAGLFCRYETAQAIKNPRKRELTKTQDIAARAQQLSGMLTSNDAPVMNRIMTELTDDGDADRKALGKTIPRHRQVTEAAARRR